MEYYNNELYHYGVKGMKWGIRRDTRVLANHRRNIAVKKIKNRYAMGEITKAQRNSQIKSEDARKKQHISSVKNKIDTTYSKEQLQKMRSNVAKQTINEVPNHTLKKGLTTVNHIMGGVHAAKTIGGGLLGMAVGGPVLGPALMASAAVGAAAEVGFHYVAQLGIDRLS